MSQPRPRVSIVLPSWNGGEILARHLHEVAAQAREIPGGAEVLVIDDCTTLAGDRTEDVCTAAGEPVVLHREDERRGFSGTCNAGARHARGEYLLFLNTDMHPAPGSLTRLVAEIERRPRCFAVSPVVENVAKNYPESETRIVFRRGVFDIEFPGRDGAPALEQDRVREIDYACGGAMICRADAYAQMGGFPEMHRPFYWEDADLGWRARRKGWNVIELGAARVAHDHMATIGAHFSPRFVKATFERNRLLFTWTHLQGFGRWARHLLWLVPRTIARAARLQPGALAVFPALWRLPGVLSARATIRRAPGPPAG